MAFKEYRNPLKNSTTHEFDIERFAYDVFAYMLRICCFPEEKIPTSRLKENIYTEDDFVTNVGLSSLPIALYMRDEWRFTFEIIFGESGTRDILEIQNYLESFIAYSGELEDEDTLSKIQYSLALYNEYTLYLNFKGIDAYFDSLPKLWSHLFKELVEQSEDFDQALESSLIMCPDISEAWISNFMRNFAIPYGSSNDVSDRFSLHTLECHGENNFSEETRRSVTDAVPEEPVQLPDISDEDTITFSPEGSDSEVSFIPGSWCQPVSSDQLEIPESVQPPDISDEDKMPFFPEDSNSDVRYVSGRWCHLVSSGQVEDAEENAFLERKAQAKHRNGLTYVLQHCLKGRKRSRSQKLEVEDAFGKINLEKENISPESHDTKRRRKISGKDPLE